MWQLAGHRPGVAKPDAKPDSAELHRERGRIRHVDGARYENDDDSADRLSQRFGRHSDPHV